MCPLGDQAFFVKAILVITYSWDQYKAGSQRQSRSRRDIDRRRRRGCQRTVRLNCNRLCTARRTVLRSRPWTRRFRLNRIRILNSFINNYNR